MQGSVGPRPAVPQSATMFQYRYTFAAESNTGVRKGEPLGSLPFQRLALFDPYRPLLPPPRLMAPRHTLKLGVPRLRTPSAFKVFLGMMRSRYPFVVGMTVPPAARSSTESPIVRLVPHMSLG